VPSLSHALFSVASFIHFMNCICALPRALLLALVRPAHTPVALFLSLAILLSLSAVVALSLSHPSRGGLRRGSHYKFSFYEGLGNSRNIGVRGLLKCWLRFRFDNPFGNRWLLSANNRLTNQATKLTDRNAIP